MSVGHRRAGLRLAALGALAYLVFLFATLPAAWIGLALERASGGALGLGDPAGSVWSGSGALALRSVSGWKSAGDISWRCEWPALFTGRLRLALSGSAPQSKLSATVSGGIGGTRIEALSANVPVALVENILVAAAYAKPEGELRLRSDSMEFSGSSARGTLTAEWIGAGLAGMQSPRLGDYRLLVTAAGERADLALTTLGGDLRISAQGEWRASQPSVQLRGNVQAVAGRKDLEPLLRLMGGGGVAGVSQSFSWNVPLR